MTANKGSMVLMKIGNAGLPEVFSTVGGLVDIRMRLNNESLDNSNCENGSWKSLLAYAGGQVLMVAARGIFLDSAAEETVRTSAFNQEVRNYRLYFGNGDYLQAAFQIAYYERMANQQDAEEYAIRLQSTGDVAYTVS
jgi:TP901-1 family phage major tail protein